jgi:hypothetical protein
MKRDLFWFVFSAIICFIFLWKGRDEMSFLFWIMYQLQLIYERLGAIKTKKGRK